MKSRAILTNLIVAIGLVLPLSAFAGGGHYHGPDGGHAPVQEVTPDSLSIMANTQLKQIVSRNVPIEGKALDSSWNTVERSSFKITSLKRGFYQVLAEHPSKGQKIFMLFDASGKLRDVNHSGKFKGIN